MAHGLQRSLAPDNTAVGAGTLCVLSAIPAAVHNNAFGISRYVPTRTGAALTMPSAAVPLGTPTDGTATLPLALARSMATPRHG